MRPARKTPGKSVKGIKKEIERRESSFIRRMRAGDNPNSYSIPGLKLSVGYDEPAHYKVSSSEIMGALGGKTYGMLERKIGASGTTNIVNALLARGVPMDRLAEHRAEIMRMAGIQFETEEPPRAMAEKKKEEPMETPEQARHRMEVRRSAWEKAAHALGLDPGERPAGLPAKAQAPVAQQPPAKAPVVAEHAPAPREVPATGALSVRELLRNVQTAKDEFHVARLKYLLAKESNNPAMVNSTRARLAEAEQNLKRTREEADRRAGQRAGVAQRGATAPHAQGAERPASPEPLPRRSPPTLQGLYAVVKPETVKPLINALGVPRLEKLFMLCDTPERNGAIAVYMHSSAVIALAATGYSDNEIAENVKEMVQRKRRW